MKWIEAKIIFDFENRQMAADLIVDLFYEFELQGVIIEDPEIVGEESWAPDAVDLPKQNAVTGYFPENDKAAGKCQILEEKLRKLQKELGITSRVLYSHIDEIDWSESWKSYFKPEQITAGIVVKPTWQEYVPAEDEIVLEIDPGMAFGTGTHPTSAMCIELIETYLKKGDSFLDIGTGSGILMIAAAKLGAAKIRGVDKDTDAVEISRQNLLQNKIEAQKFKVTVGTLLNGVQEQFSLVAANITSDLVLELLDSIGSVLTDNGIFICSGILDKNKAKVIQKMKNTGFEILATRTKDEWAAIAGKASCDP